MKRRWGPGLDRKPLKIDAVAESEDGRDLLLGEVKWAAGTAAQPLLERLRQKVAKFPLAGGRALHLAVWLRDDKSRDQAVLTPREVAGALR